MTPESPLYPAVGLRTAHVDKPNADLRVLVVDDSQSIRSFLKAILTELGVGEVLTAENGTAAIAVLDTCDGTIDLLISDLAMPGMDGVELLRMVGQRCPGVAVLTISSLDARLRFSVSQMAQHLGLTVLGLLGKPFGEQDIRLSLIHI